MPTHDIVVVGASAGGVEALITLVTGLPADFPGAIFVVLHIPATSASALDKILSRYSHVPAKTAEDGEAISPHQIYVAPPDHHLLLTADRVRVVYGPQENRHRPAIDPLFRTAALAFGPRVIGVVLSGMLNDGTAGLLAIKERGGMAYVQEPSTALFPQMPQSACKYVQVDGILPVTALAQKLTELAGEEVTIPEGANAVTDDLLFEAKVAGLDPQILELERPPGVLTSITCPECKGPLWETHNGRLLRYRCRVGHAFTGETMLEGQAENVEDALWMAINALEENAQLYSHLAATARAHQQQSKAESLDDQAQQLRSRRTAIREMLMPNGPREEL